MNRIIKLNINKIIKNIASLTIFTLFIVGLISSFSCKGEKAPGEIDWNKVIEFVPLEEREGFGEKDQIFEPIEITLLHTNDTRGNIQPCG
ncbi:MAG: hypothetical protein KKC53_03985 [Actinobacteria bacterium]|nr:hypothetical protein [Actinomycetota bacterium]